MTNRERALAVLRYRDYDRLPIVHFGFWRETLEKWVREGRLTAAEIRDCGDRSDAENRLVAKLGFDFNWHPPGVSNNNLFPGFETKVLEEMPDGFKKVLTGSGMIELHREGAGAIPAQVDYLLKGRREWEELYLPRLQADGKRIDGAYLEKQRAGGGNDAPVGLHCGSLYGDIRGWLGVEALSYLQADDPGLYAEILDAKGSLCYRMTEMVLASGVRFDFGHFWEDICFKNGPLVHPKVFAERCGPWYRKITGLLGKHGIDIVSLDCDGMIDLLIPTWIENGVNTMFPIEVGTWEASLAPWRAKYGRAVLGVGGMDKRVFAQDRRAVDAEVERLKPLVDLGGYIPCPDHRIPPDAEWDNVRYYCDRMRRTFGG